MSLLTDLKDPRVKNVNITSVEVSADMRNAKVYLSVYGGDEAQEKLALRGLQSAAGFLQQKCAKQIDTRYTPRLQFFIDEGIKNLIAVSQILENEKRSKEINDDVQEVVDAAEVDQPPAAEEIEQQPEEIEET
ncbi:MAG: 30S ribosome-binding factor RbfA [Planctomycetia bacterium]|nr:30S ribosome-binding factor RbfA [Planctomycetia bacterium]